MNRRAGKGLAHTKRQSAVCLVPLYIEDFRVVWCCIPVFLEYYSALEVPVRLHQSGTPLTLVVLHEESRSGFGRIEAAADTTVVALLETVVLHDQVLW
eukprot:5382470-Amphidinium_carterae.1